jgi:DNA invertase Pin-like site-specific DNA recombinase
VSDGFDLLAAVAAHERRQHRERCRSEVLRALNAIAQIFKPRT